MTKLGGLAAALALAACNDAVRVEWRYAIGAASVSTPLVTSDFIAFGSEVGLVVVDHDGSKRCDFAAAGEVVAAPKTDGTLIYFGSTNYVFYAVDASCREAWKFATGDRIKSDALVADGRVFVASYDGHVYALAGPSGKLLWRFPDAALEPAAPSTEAQEQTALVGDFSYSSPALDDAVLYVGNLDHHLYALDARTGSLLWRFRTGGPITSSPLVRDGVAYFGSNDGKVYALEVSRQELLWQAATGDWVNSSPVADDETVYVGSNDRHLYAIDRRSGETRHRAALEGPAIARPVIYENLLITAGGSGDGAVYFLSRADGSLFAKVETGGKIESDPVLVANRVFVTSADGYLYALRIARTTR